MASTASFIFIVVSVVLSAIQRVHAADFIYDGEARRVCKAYKLICPAKKVCALQSMSWPRAMKFPVCVHETHVKVKSNVCRKPPLPGKCEARFMRWYFNVHMGTCSWFTYSGCGGNQNNFRTAEECERHCMGKNVGNDAQKKLRKHVRHQEKIQSSQFADNAIGVNEELARTGREPKLITAPAKAAENIDLDTDITASLHLSSRAHNTTSTQREKQRRKKKEGGKQRQRKNKNKKKNRKNRISNRNGGREKTHTREPFQKLMPVELEPQTSTSKSEISNYAELKGRKAVSSRYGDSDRDERQVWMMDTRFKKQRRRNKKPAKDDDVKHIVNTQSPNSGAKQDTYYDKVKLFDILENLDELERTNDV